MWRRVAGARAFAILEALGFAAGGPQPDYYGAVRGPFDGAGPGINILGRDRRSCAIHHEFIASRHTGHDTNVSR
jgi:hypothetical protein